jgi:hypothetical protein
VSDRGARVRTHARTPTRAEGAPHLARESPHSSAFESSGFEPGERIQATLGNQAIQRLAATDAADDPARYMQAKLVLGTPGDVYEQEADRVADQVMRMPATPDGEAIPTLASPASVQRVCTECIDAREADMVQREPQPGAAPPTRARGGVTGSVSKSISALRSGGGRPLPAATRGLMESRFQRDFSGVRIHTDGRAAQTAAGVNARAFTVGRDVVFGAGQFEPGSTRGTRLLAHELTHVVQQRSARSGPEVIRRELLDPPVPAKVLSLEDALKDPTRKPQVQNLGQREARIYTNRDLTGRSELLKPGTDVKVLERQVANRWLRIDCEGLVPEDYGKKLIENDVCWVLGGFVKLDAAALKKAEEQAATKKKKPAPPKAAKGLTAPPPQDAICEITGGEAAIVVGNGRESLPPPSKVKVIKPVYDTRDEVWVLVEVTEASSKANAKPGRTGPIRRNFLFDCKVPTAYDPSAPAPVEAPEASEALAEQDKEPARPETKASPAAAASVDVGFLDSTSTAAELLNRGHPKGAWPLYTEAFRGVLAEAEEQAAAGGLGPVAVKLLDKLKEMRSNPIRAFQFIIGFLKGIPEGLISFFTDFIDLFKEVPKLVLKIHKWLTQKVAGFVDLGKERLTELGKSLAALGPDIGTLFSDLARDPLKAFGALLNAVGGALVGGFQLARKAAMEAVVSILSSVADMTHEQLGRTIGKIFGSFIPDIVLSHTGLGVIAVIVGKIGKVAKVFTFAIRSMKSLRGVLKLLGEAWDLVHGFFARFLGSLGDIASGAWKKISAVFDDIKTFIDDIIAGGAKSHTPDVPGGKLLTSLDDVELSKLKTTFQTGESHGLSIVREGDHLRLRMCSGACATLGKKLKAAMDLAEDGTTKGKLKDLAKRVADFERKLDRGKLSAEDAAGQLRQFGEEAAALANKDPAIKNALDSPFGKRVSPDEWDYLMSAKGESILPMLGKPAAGNKGTLKALGYDYIPASSERRAYIRRRDGHDGPPLHIDEHDNIALGSASATRIVDSGQLRVALAKEARVGVKQLPLRHQAHHVVPGEAISKNPLLKLAVEKGYNPDRASNGILLAEDALSATSETKKLPLHHTSHGKYNQHALSVAQQVMNNTLRRAGKKSVSELTLGELLAAAKEIEDKMRAHLKTLPAGKQLE